MRYLRAEGGWDDARTGSLGLGDCPVRWLNRHALVALPERVEESNAKPVSEESTRTMQSFRDSRVQRRPAGS